MLQATEIVLMSNKTIIDYELITYVSTASKIKVSAIFEIVTALTVSKNFSKIDESLEIMVLH